MTLEAFARISAIYDVEACAREKQLHVLARYALRQSVPRPLVDSTFNRSNEARPEGNNSSADFWVVDYIQRTEPAIAAYLD